MTVVKPTSRNKITTIELISLFGSMQPLNAEPLAVEVLAGAIKNEFKELVVTEFNDLVEEKDPDGSQLANKLIMRSDIDIIGISIPQSTYHLALNFLTQLKHEKIHALILLGHALPTHSPELFLEKFPDVVIVRGWGEETVCGIIKQYRRGDLNFAILPNLVFKKNEQLQHTQIRWPQSVPSPLRAAPKRYFARIKSSRGCHYDVCTFCTRQPRTQNEPGWFRFPVDHVLQQVEHIKSEGVTNFTFADEDFVGHDLEGAIKITHGLREIGGMKFSLSLRADNVLNPGESKNVAQRRLELFRELKKAGLSLTYLGIESLSDTQLRRYGKGITATKSIRSVNLLLQTGISVESGIHSF